jgi:hypothetical protein
LKKMLAGFICLEQTFPSLPLGAKRSKSRRLHLFPSSPVKNPDPASHHTQNEMPGLIYMRKKARFFLMLLLLTYQLAHGYRSMGRPNLSKVLGSLDASTCTLFTCTDGRLKSLTSSQDHPNCCSHRDPDRSWCRGYVVLMRMYLLVLSDTDY